MRSTSTRASPKPRPPHAPCAHDGANSDLMRPRRYDPEAEAMVQLLLTFLAKEGSRKDAPDDRAAFAAALRMRHGREHFARMGDEMARYWRLLDGAPDKRHLLDQVGACTAMSETFSAAGGGVARGSAATPAAGASGATAPRGSAAGGPGSAAPRGSAAGGSGGGGGECGLMGVGLDGGNRITRADINSALAIRQLSMGSGAASLDVLDSLWDVELVERDPAAGFRRFCFSHRMRLVDVLRTIDGDGDGTVTRTELARALVAMKMPLQPEAIADFVAELDANGDGAIAYEEFGLAAPAAFHSGQAEESQKAQSRIIDLEAAAEAAALVPSVAFDATLFEANPLQGVVAFLELAQIPCVPAPHP